MVTKKTKSELSELERYRVGLANAVAQPKISKNMALYGYTADKIAEGQQIFDHTMVVFNANKTEDDETSEASKQFKNELADIENNYRSDRRKARILFRDEPILLKRLGIVGNVPETYLNLMHTCKTFYTVALADSAISDRLAVLNTPLEHLSTMQNKLIQIENTRIIFLREMGESQEATKAKDKAIADLEWWMRDFYAVARIAMEDEPQLLEALGIFVKS